MFRLRGWEFYKECITVHCFLYRFPRFPLNVFLSYKCPKKKSCIIFEQPHRIFYSYRILMLYLCNFLFTFHINIFGSRIIFVFEKIWFKKKGWKWGFPKKVYKCIKHVQSCNEFYLTGVIIYPLIFKSI